MSLLQLMFKFHFHKHLLPDVFQQYYVTNSSIHDYSTRNKGNLHFESVCSNFGKKCSAFRAGQFWINLSNYLKVPSTYALFKNNIKQYLFYRCKKLVC